MRPGCVSEELTRELDVELAERLLVELRQLLVAHPVRRKRLGQAGHRDIYPEIHVELVAHPFQRHLRSGFAHALQEEIHVVSVNFSRVIAVHAVAPGHSSSVCHLLRQQRHGSTRHAAQRRDAHMHLVDTHLLHERGRDRVVHVLREGKPASGSFVNRTPADESQRGFRRHARSTRLDHRRRRSRDFARPPRRACVQRASLRGRPARREVGRVEGAKNVMQNAPARRRESPNFGATSDEFAETFMKVSQKLSTT